MPAGGTPQRGTDAESLLGEVESHARIPAEPIELAPDDMGGIHAALVNEVLEQPPEIVPGNGRHHPGALAPPLPHPPPHVFLPPPPPPLNPPPPPPPPHPRPNPTHHSPN